MDPALFLILADGQQQSDQNGECIRDMNLFNVDQETPGYAQP